MNRRFVLALSTLALLPLLFGCAGLMMNVKDLDKSHSSIALAKGESVAIEQDSLEKSFAEAKAQDPKALADKLAKKIIAQLEEKGVAVDPSSSQKLKVQITRYKRGSGFARGFFPFFGLGDSYLDGQVELVAEDGTRVIVVEKTGQKSGTSQMGDQTEENIGYFASVLVSRLTEDGEANEAKD